MTKKELRILYKQKRLDLSAKDKVIFDDLMLLQLQTFNFEGVKTLLTYWPIEENNEPNSSLFSRYLSYFVPNLRIAYPVSDFTTNTMNALIVDEETIFETNKYGLTEPKEGIEIDPNEIDLIFVPNLICDKQGFRLGYGKGFYDRFLTACNTDVMLIGFNYFEPINSISDIDEFDIPLNYCITPNNVFEFLNH